MPPRFTPGDSVQTPFGKGEVREIRNKGRILVSVGGRALVLADAQLTPVCERRRSRAPAPAGPHPRERARGPRSASTAAEEVDLHGLTVEEALTRMEQALNEALLADAPELRIIHGRSGGRLRAAVHRRLREIASVRAFRLDPRNEGVTIVEL